MFHRFTITLIPFILLLTTGGCGGSEDPDEPFLLSRVSARHLVKQGMEKEIVRDTVITGRVEVTHDTAVSADGTKRAWCDGRALVVADDDDPEGVVLHDEVGHGGLAACLSPVWSEDGSEVSYLEFIPGEAGGDSVYQITRVIIALGEGESD